MKRRIVVYVTILAIGAYALIGGAQASDDPEYSSSISGDLVIEFGGWELTPGDTYKVTWKFTSPDGREYWLGGNAQTVRASGYLKEPTVALDDLTQGNGYAGGTYEAWLRPGDSKWVDDPPALGPDGLPLEYEITLP